MHEITRQQNNTLNAFVQITLAGLFFFYEFIQLNLPNAIYHHLMSQFQLNVNRFGMLSSIYLFGDLLFIFLAGLIIDTFPIKKIVLSAMSICLLSVCIFHSAHFFTIAMIARFIMGATDAFCLLSCLKLATYLFDDSKLALLTGWTVTMAMLGGYIAQKPTVMLLHHFGYTQTVYLNILLGIIIITMIYLLMDNHESIGNEAHNEFNFDEIQLVLKNKYNWLCGLYTSLINLPSIVLGMTWGIMYLEKVKYLSPTSAAHATGMIFIGNIVGSTTLGWLSDKLQNRHTIMLICALLALTIICTIIASSTLSSNATAMLMLFLGIISSAQILSYPIIMANNPQRLVSTANSCALLLVLGIAGISTWLFGLLIELHHKNRGAALAGVYNHNDLQFAMLLLPACFLSAILICLLIKDSH